MLFHCFKQAFGCDWKMCNASAHSIANSIRDSGTDRDNWRFAYTFRAEGTERGRYLDKDGREIGYVLTMRQGIIHQRRGECLTTLIVDQPLEERPTNTLRNSALNLSCYLSGIDGKAH